MTEVESPPHLFKQTQPSTTTEAILEPPPLRTMKVGVPRSSSAHTIVSTLTQLIPDRHRTLPRWPCAERSAPARSSRWPARRISQSRPRRDEAVLDPQLHQRADQPVRGFCPMTTGVGTTASVTGDMSAQLLVDACWLASLVARLERERETTERGLRQLR